MNYKNISLTLFTAGFMLTACSGPSRVPVESEDMSGEEGDMSPSSPDMSSLPEVDMTGSVDCEESVLFPALTAHPKNGAYPDPELRAWCDEELLYVQSNGIIDYEYVAVTPTGLGEQDYLWKIPRQPVEAEQPIDIPLLGPVGITVNGLPFYGPNEGERPDAFGDPVFNSILDECMGHTAQQRDYHYHALLVECLVKGVDQSGPDPIIGFAFDGYAIYGPRGCSDASCSSVVTYQSGWEKTGDPATYAWDNYGYMQSDDPTKLDECNGHVGPKGDYHYHATSGFPYIIGCFHGEDRVPEGFGPPDMPMMMDGPPACTSDTECRRGCPSPAGCACLPAKDQELRCLPTCNSDADCPEMTPSGAVLECRDNVCRPKR